MIQTESPPPVDKSSHRVREMFGQIAGRYDFLNHLLSMNIDRYWRNRTVRAVGPLDDGPILDLCTGTGDLALALHRAADGKAKVIGADFCRPMLTIGHEKKTKACIGDQLEFVEADALALPFPDDTFQVVSVAFGLRNLADTDAGLREMARVLWPGGKLAVLEFSLPKGRLLRAVYGWYFCNVLPRLGQWLSGNSASAYNYLPESVTQFPSGQDLADRMLSMGFSKVTFTPLTCGVATLYIGVK